MLDPLGVGIAIQDHARALMLYNNFDWTFARTCQIFTLRFLSKSSPSLTLDCTIYFIFPSIVVLLYDNFYWTLARTCVWWLIRTSAWYVFLASEWSLFTPQHYNNSLLTLNLKITIISFLGPNIIQTPFVQDLVWLLTFDLNGVQFFGSTVTPMNNDML